MTIREALRKAIESLEFNGFEEATLEAELLVRHLLGFSKVELHIQLEYILSVVQTQELDRLIQRRLGHEPIAYITGNREFFGLDFHVNQDTLVPRPETELLVEKALELADNRASPIKAIAEVGTGSGAIAVAMAVHLPGCNIYAIDISAAALAVASLNCGRHKVTSRVHLLQGDLLHPMSRQKFDIIIANLPYINDREMLELGNEVRLFEPTLALSGGLTGLSQIVRILGQAGDKLSPGGALLLEISPGQRAAVVDLALSHLNGAKVTVYPDLSGDDRVVVVDTATQELTFL